MNKEIIDENSWHYRFYKFYSVYKSLNQTQFANSTSFDHAFSNCIYMNPKPKDFCSHWRNAVFWPALSIIITMSLWIFCGLIIYTLGLTNVVLASSVFVIGAGLLFGGLVLAAFIYSILEKSKEAIKLVSQMNKNAKEKKSNILVIKYKSWKEKHCPLIEYKNGDET
ncbi:MAG: hypothetical protein COA52_00970 [Hyphomicrobiales bacterium]|nr:MAG: hypothetical protein COA52_00970 [Hyphomicrobiales bacterium]